MASELAKQRGAPLTYWVKHWPTDLAVMGLIPRESGNLVKPKQGSIAHNLSLSSSHLPDITEIQLKWM